MIAEQEAREKKRKAEGKPALEPFSARLAIADGADEESNKRRKLLQDAMDLDKDDEEEAPLDKGKGKADDADDRRVFLL